MPSVSTAIVPSVAAELNSRVTGTGALDLPILTVPILAAVCGLMETTVNDCETVGAAAHATPSPGWLA